MPISSVDKMNVTRIHIIMVALIALAIASCSGPARREPAYPEPLPQKSAGELAEQAEHHIGEPYRYGGLTSRGWDCSGFVRTMYKNTLGIQLPRTAHDMYLEAFPLPLERGRAGDLVFFDIGRKKPSHVGIYIGDKRFIHVSKSEGVVVSSLLESYYSRHFIGLRRVPIARANKDR